MDQSYTTGTTLESAVGIAPASTEKPSDDSRDLIQSLRKEFAYGVVKEEIKKDESSGFEYTSATFTPATFLEDTVEELLDVVRWDEDLAEIALRFVYDHIGTFYGYTGKAGVSTDQEAVDLGLRDVIDYINTRVCFDYELLEGEFINHGKRDEDGLSEEQLDDPDADYVNHNDFDSDDDD